MLREIGVGVDFICSLLNGKVPEEPLTEFKQRLVVALQERFLGHWNPESPYSGSAYRCILTTMDKVDPVLRTAVDNCKATNVAPLMKGLTSNLPPYLSVWIDPCEVSYRIGTQGSICHLTSDEGRERRTSPNTVLSASTKPFVPTHSNTHSHTHEKTQMNCGLGTDFGFYSTNSYRLVEALPM